LPNNPGIKSSNFQFFSIMEKTFGPILVDHVAPSAYKQGRNQAQLRQVVTRAYAGGRVGNDLQDAFVSKEAFGFAEQTYDENRVAWVDVPTSWDVARVEAHLKTMPKACIYKILSTEPILTSDQESWAESLTSEEAKQFVQRIADRQLVVDSDNNPVLYKGVPQYRATFFSATERGDLDQRSEDVVPRFEVTHSTSAEQVETEVTASVEDEEQF
jgi:hypothetical protein